MGKLENTFSERDSVGTPPRVFEAITRILGPIGLDPCSHPGSEVPAGVRYYLPEYAPTGMPLGAPVALPTNGKIPAHIAVVGDGLELPWGPGLGLVYANPPYSRLSSDPWITRALAAPLETTRGERKREARPAAHPDEIVWLLPVRTAGSWWQRDLVHTAHVITFLKFRVKHTGEKDPSPFHQVLAYRGPRAQLWYEAANDTLGHSYITRAA